jgi:hypothetical protein
MHKRGVHVLQLCISRGEGTLYPNGSGSGRSSKLRAWRLLVLWVGIIVFG